MTAGNGKAGTEPGQDDPVKERRFRKDSRAFRAAVLQGKTMWFRKRDGKTEMPEETEKRNGDRTGDEVVRLRMIFSGEVQGVGFRWIARQAASELGVTGWVENEYDGTVLMEAQGTKEQIERLISTISSARWVEIRHIDSRSIPLEEHEYSFHVKDYY